MHKTAIILAGGTGSRAGSDIPKQFVRLLGIPVLWWSVRAFAAEDPSTEIRLAVHPDWIGTWREIHASLPEADRKITVGIYPGGSSRAESVRNALEGLSPEGGGVVAVHDGARPLVTPELVGRVFRQAAGDGSSVPVVPVTDSLRVLDPEDGSSRSVDRAPFRAVQTPQAFHASLLQQAYSLPDRPDFTDDASRVEALGHPVNLIQGDPSNLKVTNLADFTIAAALLTQAYTR